MTQFNVIHFNIVLSFWKYSTILQQSNKVNKLNGCFIEDLLVFKVFCYIIIEKKGKNVLLIKT